jgi:hypothetical protein
MDKGKLIRWIVGIAAGVLIGLYIAVLMVSRAPQLRKALVQAINDQFDADVQLDSMEVRMFPRFRIHGDGLTLLLKNGNRQPFIEVRHFEVTTGLMGMLHRPRRFSSVDLDGLRITIPPGSHGDGANRQGNGISPGPVIIEHVTSHDAQLIILPKDPAKDPKIWSIHTLELDSAGFNRQMPFTATLTNPIPKGEIATKGTFGPWAKDDPGQTPVGGHYTFDHADLSTINGIGGILDSTGDFSGMLARIDVHGKTSTPDFTLDVGATPVPLETTFYAVVDGTNGDTYLKQIDATLGKTPIEASGAVVTTPHVKGRTVMVDATIHDGRIEDALQLAMHTAKPVMTGQLGLQTSILLPPGDARVVERLQLAGRFALEQAQCTDAGVKAHLEDLSRHAQGKKPGEAVGPISSTMTGRFAMRDAALRLEPVRFSLPGADVQLTGGYGLRSEQLDFSGTLSMEAAVSEAMGGGIKSLMLKPFDSIFRKNGKGAVVPITITGPRSDPKFGLQWGKVFK